MYKINDLKKTVSQEFHDKTKIKKQGIELPSSKWPKQWIEINYKGYPRFKALKLSKPNLGKVTLEQVLSNRKSRRNYSTNAISENELSTLLFYSAGINELNSGSRFYPSAGARYPLEIYPILFNVDGVKAGQYHYYVKRHLLEKLPSKKGFKKKAMAYFGNQDWSANSAVFLVISAVFLRNQIKYGERGYRHVLSEMGSLIQNIYLVSTILGVGCCPTGGYMDDKFNNLLDLDGTEESVIGVVALGKVKHDTKK